MMLNENSRTPVKLDLDRNNNCYKHLRMDLLTWLLYFSDGTTAYRLHCSRALPRRTVVLCLRVTHLWFQA